LQGEPNLACWNAKFLIFPGRPPTSGRACTQHRFNLPYAGGRPADKNEELVLLALNLTSENASVWHHKFSFICQHWNALCWVI